MTSSPRRAASPIPTSSRLLQHTTSTIMKSKEPPASPLQRDSLSFHMSGRGRSPGRSDSPTKQARTNSPRCRAEAYALHFQGSAVADVFAAPGSVANSRSSSPGGGSRNVRRAASHREESMFASECNNNSTYHSAAGGGYGQNGVVRHASKQNTQPGLWTRQEGSERAAFTGSRRHFHEPPQTGGVVGTSNGEGGLLIPHIQSLDSTADSSVAMEMGSVSGSEATAGTPRYSKRMLNQPINMNGSACRVTGATRDETITTGKQGTRFHRKTAPYFYHDDGVDGGAAPTTSARMHTSQQPQQQQGRMTNGARSSILDYREGGWGDQPKARREIAPVEGHGGGSLNVTNLGAYTPADVREKTQSIKTMAGPPTFVPPPMRARSPIGQRMESPFRAQIQSTISLATHPTTPTTSAVPAPVATTLQHTPAQTAVGGGGSPMRSGRGVGLYSPLRQTGAPWA